MTPATEEKQLRETTLNLRDEIVGINSLTPLRNGQKVQYVNLDNAASTPAFRRVVDKVSEALEMYSSVHRGSGFKSLFSTYLYDKAREVAANFVGADREHDVVIFGKNTTEAINKLARRFPFEPGDVVLTTVMEHHSNDLPWRAVAQTEHVEVTAEGTLDISDLEAKLAQHRGRVKLVTVTGASNVSGFMPPIYDVAELAHQYGAQCMVDCAQLLPHRKIDMGEPDSPRHLDFIAFSAHKVYAPFGSGVLIGPKAFFNRGDPDYRGGGTVEIVTLDEVEWTDAPERDEAGSPNVLGAVALAAALEQLNEVGMEKVAEHEKALTRYALHELGKIRGVRLFGSKDPHRLEDRVGVIPFEVEGMPHAKLAAILGFEGGIGVRNGCFCAHPYVLRLLKVENQEFLTHRQRVLSHDRSDLPGFVRASFGCYNETSDIDRLTEVLERIVEGDYIDDYLPHKQSGSYYPKDFVYDDLAHSFHF
ncbi:MAG: aminotransferase class V-fold PLP-dependent enzyme [Chloroflexota bacterium]